MKIDLVPLQIDADPSLDSKLLDRFQDILESWEDTPYMDGQQAKGVGVDCVHFVSAVLDELEGIKIPLDKIPQDACFHDKEKCSMAFRKFMRVYGAVNIGNYNVQPGDVIICGPSNGGPGQAVSVGPHGFMWHCDGYRVSKRGCEFFNLGEYVFKTVLRSKRRSNWIKNLENLKKGNN